VFINIKKAFNIARKDYIYKVLRDKGILENIIKWTINFISNREIYLKREET